MHFTTIVCALFVAAASAAPLRPDPNMPQNSPRPGTQNRTPIGSGNGASTGYPNPINTPNRPPIGPGNRASTHYPNPINTQNRSPIGSGNQASTHRLNPINTQNLQSSDTVGSLGGQLVDSPASGAPPADNFHIPDNRSNPQTLPQYTNPPRYSQGPQELPPRYNSKFYREH